MKSRTLIIGTILSLIIAIMIPGVAAAKGGKPPQDDPPQAAGLLYGDLYVVERDGAGVPLTRRVTYEYVDSETGETEDDFRDCLQPLAYDCSLLFLWGECGSDEDDVPDGVPYIPECTFDPEVNDACAVYNVPFSVSDPDDPNIVIEIDYASEIQEVSFGRGSVTRSQAFVIDSAYGEFLNVINDAVGLSLDPAGRFTMCLEKDEYEQCVLSKTVDAPLENLGMYRASMSYGCFHWVQEEKTGDEGATITVTSALDPSAIELLRDPELGLGHLVCDYIYEPDPLGDEWPKEVCEPGPCWWEIPGNFDIPDRDPVTNPTYEPGDRVEMADMMSATAFLAAATDKGDPLSLDETMTINTYIGINIWELIEGDTKKDKDELVIKYFPFATDPTDPAASWFEYTRTDAFPDTTTADLLFYDEDGVLNNLQGVFQEDPNLPLFDTMSSTFQYDRVALDEVNLNVCRGGFDVGETCDNFSADVPYDPDAEEPSFGCGGANWFAQAAEHRRLTVWYLHNWSVPVLGSVP